MPSLTVTRADIGTSLPGPGTVTNIQLLDPPSDPGYWFTLTDTNQDGVEVTIFNMQTSSTPVPTGTIFPLHDQPFTNLILKSIGPGSRFIVNTSP